MRREVAQQRTRRAQITAVILVVIAGGVFAMPGLFSPAAGEVEATPPAAKPKVTAVPTSAEQTTAALAQVDIKQILEAVRPPRPSRVEAPVAPAKPDEPAPPAVAEAPWRYIGVILGQTREAHRAIVTVGESQRMLREGETVDQDRVDEITEEYLLVTGAGGAQRKIEMVARMRADIVITTASTGAEMTGLLVEDAPLTPEEQRVRDRDIQRQLKDQAHAAVVRISKAEQRGRAPTDANVLGPRGEKILQAMNKGGRSSGVNDGFESFESEGAFTSAMTQQIAQLRRLRDSGQITPAEFAQRVTQIKARANDQEPPPTTPGTAPPAPQPITPPGTGGVDANSVGTGTTVTGPR